jgi:hypothetical protein
MNLLRSYSACERGKGIQFLGIFVSIFLQQKVYKFRNKPVHLQKIFFSLVSSGCTITIKAQMFCSAPVRGTTLPPPPPLPHPADNCFQLYTVNPVSKLKTHICRHGLSG